ncbi:hypothetical protein GCM10017607_10940 [Microbacterium thalassium]|nr:hypothetical protein GCM10017607_10940 [Microbacterium thalassium]
MRGEASEDDVGRVDDKPLALGFASLGGVSARHSSAAFLIRTERFVNPTPGWFCEPKAAEPASGGLTFAVPRQRDTGTKESVYVISDAAPKRQDPPGS